MSRKKLKGTQASQIQLPVIKLVSLPLECVLYGVPATLQSANARIEQWKSYVKDALRERRGSGTSCLPHGVPVRVRVRYYFAGQLADRDTDNILKPILDAAKGVIYQDDRQVIEACSHRFSRDEGSHVTGNELTLQALRAWTSDFVHIQFRDGLSR